MNEMAQSLMAHRNGNAILYEYGYHDAQSDINSAINCLHMLKLTENEYDNMLDRYLINSINTIAQKYIHDINNETNMRDYWQGYINCLFANLNNVKN